MLALMLKLCMVARLLKCGSSFISKRQTRITGAYHVSHIRIRSIFTFSMLRGVDEDTDAPLNGLTPVLVEAPKDKESALLSHLRTRITWALETWTAADSMNASSRADIAKNVVDAIIESRKSEPLIGDARQQNKMLVDYGSIVAKALRATPGSLAELRDDIKTLDTTIAKYQQHLEKNRAVYININKHHESLIKKSYAAAVGDVVSLNEYADAANLMGKKVWVQEGNMWMEEFSLNFFRRNGARKDYLKSHNHDPSVPGDREKAEALPRDIMLEETFIDEVINEHNRENSTVELSENLSGFHPQRNSIIANAATNDVISSTTPSLSSPTSSDPRLIRLVDVGSCYNPLAKSANKAAFCVTALDLCPVDPSVYQCDFLDLEIGEKGSDPVIIPITPSGQDSVISVISDSLNSFGIPKEASDILPASDVEENNSVNNVSSKLLQLPKASYDVVTMSLVLNYLPTPELRENMIKKARGLLIGPGDGGQPHRAGLLLIIEKESIFSSDNDSKKSLSKHNNSTLLNCWKDTICSYGFELVRYRNILTSQDKRRCHALAFKTKNIPPLEGNSTIEASSSGVINEKNSNKQSDTAVSVSVSDNLLLKNTIANKILFDSGKSGMWIKQDFLNSIDVENVEKRSSAGGKLFESKKDALKVQYATVEQDKNAKRISQDSALDSDVNLDLINENKKINFYSIDTITNNNSSNIMNDKILNTNSNTNSNSSTSTSPSSQSVFNHLKQNCQDSYH